MRAAALILAVATAAPAFAGPGYASSGKPVRKPAPAGVADEHLKAFVAGIVADKQGDLAAAARHYENAVRKSPQANTYYNLADVLRRMERVEAAVTAYNKYLELAPNAPDKAAVQALIADLGKLDHIAVIDGDDLDALVLVDGKLVGPSPQIARMPAGRHAVDRLSPRMYRHTTFDARPGHTEHITLNTSSDERDKPQGNVILSESAQLTTSGSWEDKDSHVMFHLPGRQTLRPGHYATMLWNDARGCQPMVFDVPKLGPNEVLFVYLEGQERKPGECQKFATRVQRLTLTGGAK